MGIILMICGMYCAIFSLVSETDNLPTAIVFGVIPFLVGLMSIICAMHLFGWINIC